MTPNTPEQITKALVNIDAKILTLAYKDLAQPGVKQVGKALSTVLGLGNTALLPLKLVNEKARLWFTSHMEGYRKRLESIPAEQIVDVAPEIGVPILEKLEKTTNEKLSELYLNLLAGASVAGTAALAHPRFVLLIESMAPDEAKVDEAKVLEYIRDSNMQLPLLRATAHKELAEGEKKEETPIETVLKDVTVLATSNYLTFPNNSRLYINNLVALGLLSMEDNRMTLDQKDYKFLTQHFGHEIQHNAHRFARTRQVENVYIITHHGYYELTDLGMSFLSVCSPRA